MIIDKQSDIIADSVDIQRSVVVETVILLGDCMGVGGGMDWRFSLGMDRWVDR